MISRKEGKLLKNSDLFSGFLCGVIDSVGFMQNIFPVRLRFLLKWLLMGAVFLGVLFSLIMQRIAFDRTCLLDPGKPLPPLNFRSALLPNNFPPVAMPLQTTSREYLSSVLPQHRVRPGETLYSLSRRYFTPLSALAGLNQIADPRTLRVGQVLLIPPVDFKGGALQQYGLKNGETFADILVRYDLDLWLLQRINPGSDVRKIKPGVTINVPKKPLESRLSILGIYIARPVNGFLTSRYGFRWGRMHYGLDLAAPSGTPVKAAAAGRVEYAGWAGGYGRYVKINHGAYSTAYGHLSSIQVLNGITVRKGQQIGLVGRTGHAYGSHLHFEVECKGRKVNPYSFLY